ncbi:hypothetical protein [Cohnella sp. REN36]|uniref:hypothetical protein n=1 Tax=Cohnella sp. REN36 TaxID=2887347 RepID=UPI001D13C1FD|nr:hypothetical protein [Cohnella sp. REN36]MCC3371624.1 hypothetical protein [Cohnella sp. REN36]
MQLRSERLSRVVRDAEIDLTMGLLSRSSDIPPLPSAAKLYAHLKQSLGTPEVGAAAARIRPPAASSI